jgi:hypothetical protein
VGTSVLVNSGKLVRQAMSSVAALLIRRQQTHTL